MTDVVIIGAGISGLSLAYYLHRAGISVTVLEKEFGAGGAIQTKRAGGILLECGPNTVLAKPDLLRLIEDLDLSQSVVFADEKSKRRFIALPRRAGGTPELTATPAGPLSALTSPLLSIRGKLRVLLEPFVPRLLVEDLDVNTFMNHRLGPQFTERIISPALSGIWAADIGTLSCRSALPLLWEAVEADGSLSRGLLKHALKKKAAATPADRKGRRSSRSRLLSLRNGLGQLVDSLCAALPEGSLKLGCEVTELVAAEDSVGVYYRESLSSTESDFLPRSLDASLVVITGPANDSACLLENWEPTLAARIRAIPYAPLGVVHLALPRSAPMVDVEGYGFLVPPFLGMALLGAISSSTLFPGRAPEDTRLFTCFAGGAARPEWSDPFEAEVLERIVGEFASLTSVEGKLDLVCKSVWPEAIPNYPLHHFRLQEDVCSFERRYPRIRVLANWRKGISVADRVSEAVLLSSDLVRSWQEIGGASQSARVENL